MSSVVVYIRAVARVRAEMRILAEDEDKRRNFAPRFGLLPARRHASAGASHGPASDCVRLRHKSVFCRNG